MPSRKGFLFLIEAGTGIIQVKLHNFYENGFEGANTILDRTVGYQFYFLIILFYLIGNDNCKKSNYCDIYSNNMKRSKDFQVRLCDIHMDEYEPHTTDVS